jgi:hypothetical protein
LGKIAVVAVLLLGLALPTFLDAAPGNQAGELAREEVMFQGMIDQLCNMYDNGDYQGLEAAIDSLNARRNAAYRRRGRPLPESLFCESQVN